MVQPIPSYLMALAVGDLVFDKELKEIAIITDIRNGCIHAVCLIDGTGFVVACAFAKLELEVINESR